MALTSPFAPIKELTLDNGLNIIVGEISQADETIIHLQYKVSERNELPNNAGINNIVYRSVDESLDFKPTTASTLKDFTYFACRITPKDLDAIPSSLAASISEFTMTDERLQAAKDFQNTHWPTRKTILPDDDLPQELSELLFPNNGYANYDCGAPDTLSKIDLAQAEQWYQRWYIPNNATLIVTGNVNAEYIFQAAERYFSKMPRGALETVHYRKEAGELGRRHIELHKDTSDPLLLLAFNLPGFDFFKDRLEEDSALVMFGQLMKDGLTYKGYECDVYMPIFKDAGYFSIRINTSSANQSPSELEREILDLFDELKTDLRETQALEFYHDRCGSFLLEREKDPVMLLDTISQLHYANVPLNDREKAYNAMLNVTPKDILHVIKTYLTESRMATAHIFPVKDSAQ